MSSTRLATVAAALALSVVVGGAAALVTTGRDANPAPDSTESVVEDAPDETSVAPADGSSGTAAADDSTGSDTAGNGGASTGDASGAEDDEGPTIQTQPFDPDGVDADGGFDVRAPNGS
jgi:hypothetical protein